MYTTIKSYVRIFETPKVCLIEAKLDTHELGFPVFDITPGFKVNGRFTTGDRRALERTYINMAGSILVLEMQTELFVHGLARCNDLLDEIKVVAGT